MKKRVSTRKLIFRTQYNSPLYKGKKMDDSLVTQPDQNMSIRELLDRHSRGLPLGVSENKGEYFETEIPKFDDLVDLMEYKKRLTEKQKELETQAKAEVQEAKTKRELLEKEQTEKKVEPEKGTNL